MSLIRTKNGASKGMLSPPSAPKRRGSAILESPGLTPFERAYLEKLQNNECPKARVKFSPDDQVPTDTDFVFRTENSTPKEASVPMMAGWKNEFTGRRGSLPFIDSSEVDRLEHDLEPHNYKSYYKNIGKSMKAFDATFLKGPSERKE